MKSKNIYLDKGILNQISENILHLQLIGWVKKNKYKIRFISLKYSQVRALQGVGKGFDLVDFYSSTQDLYFISRFVQLRPSLNSIIKKETFIEEINKEYL